MANTIEHWARSGDDGRSISLIGTDEGWCQLTHGVEDEFSMVWHLNAASGKVCLIEDFESFFFALSNAYFDGSETWPRILIEAGFYPLGEDE